MKNASRQATGERLTTRYVWWVDPTKFLLLVVLPVFAVSSYYGSAVMDQYGMANFIDWPIFLLGVVSILSMVIGGMIGKRLMYGVAPSRFGDPKRMDVALATLLIVCIVSHVILMAYVVADIGTVMRAFNGERGAAYLLKNNMTKIVGVTSFSQLYIIAIPLYFAYQYIFDRRPPKNVRILLWVTFVLVFVRAFLLLERFALIEAAVPAAVCYLTFRPRRAALVGFYPLIGFVAVYLLFAAGEFTRSWGYHADSAESFWEYTNIRLLGYIATATNNGAGVYEYYGSFGYPYMTAVWLRRLPLWEFVGVDLRGGLTSYFEAYGNAEFNNPSGVLAGLVDFGPALFWIYNGFMGIIGGMLYAQFRKGSAFAVTFYPGWYIGFLLLTQAIYWGDPRFFTISVVAPFVAFYVTGGKRSTYTVAGQASR